KQLLVEGRDAQVLCIALLSQLDVADVQVQDFGGNDDLRGFLKALRVSPNFETIPVQSVAIVRDAENNAAAALDAVRNALRDAGFAVPPGPLGRVGAPQTPRVSFLILPDGVNGGKLETMCLESVSTDPAIRCVDQYFECLNALGLETPSNFEKARVQAFL